MGRASVISAVPFPLGMSWHDTAVKLTIVGFAGTLLYAGCSIPAVEEGLSRVPVAAEVMAVRREAEAAYHAARSYQDGSRSIDLVSLLMALHEPTAPIGEWGRDVGETYLGINPDLDLVGALRELDGKAQPLIDLARGEANGR